MGEVAQALMETPLGNVLSAGEATELEQAAKKKTVPRGQYLFKVNDPGSALYIILTGSLDVKLGQPGSDTVVASLGPGQIVGELEVMTASLRVASLLATEETALLEIGAQKFDELVKQNKPSAVKLLATISKALARRLAAVNQRIITKPAAAPAPAPAKSDEPEVIADADVVVDNSDLDVLDKLWS